ncbi:MAG TPA: prohibitin family protein [Candidatus Eisenbacteria bacterium]|nr:prohibitin family protein [Candidatus Eisenbacteria bacterium]
MHRFAAFLLVIALASGCAAVPAQHVGVLETFGKVHDTTWGPGLHVWLPWMGVHRINCRTMQLEERTSTPTGEGLVVGLDVSLLYHPEPVSAKDIYARYGGVGGLTANVLIPEFRSVIRDVTAGFNAVDLYSGRREEIGKKMLADLRTRLSGRGINVEAVLLRNIVLPEQVAKAVEAKLAADQQAQQMEFVLRKEQKEADRKRIEAQGIADFQRIVTAGITPGLLTWKGIEATKDLAASPNAKVIIAGGKNGLPVILNMP